MICSTSGARLHGLDTLRAAAIAAVMLYHFNMQGLLPPVLVPLAQVGWAGVDLFFVLSGFLIGGQLLRTYRAAQRPGLGDFYRRRAYRILPAFGVVLLLYLFVPLWREAPGRVAGWQYATFTWNLLLLGYPGHRAFSHIWSLCVEEHFYLFFPLLLSLAMRKATARSTVLLVLGFLLGGIALRAWLLYSVLLPAGEQQDVLMMKYIYYPTYARLDGLLLGVTLAAIRTFRPHWWSRFHRHSSLLALCGAALVLCALRLCAFNYPDPALPASILVAFPTLALGFALLVAAATYPRAVLGRRLPGASGVAALAFSLYLTHKSVAHATHAFLPTFTAQSSWHALALYTLTCTAVASLLHFAVERPFLQLRATRDGHRSATAVDRETRLNPAL